MAITFDDVAPKLKTIEQTRAALSVTEPLVQHTLPLNGTGAPSFVLNSGWNLGLASKAGTALVNARVKFGSTELMMTKDAVLEAASSIGLSRQYLTKTPGALIEPHLNYWYQNQEKEVKLLASEGGVALAFTRASISPFSNLTLLNGAVEEIQERFNISESDIFVDFKFQHDLRLTRVRLIVPSEVTHIGKDQWSTGLQIQNSLTAGTTTGLRGYLFTWACTNGMISTHATSGNWNRKRAGKDADVFAWARQSVDEIFDGLEHELESVKDIAETPLQDPLELVLQDIFASYRVPLQARNLIIERLVNRQAESEDPITMYDIQYVITQIANESDAPEPMREALMEIGGDLPRAYSDRCGNCHRLALES